MAASQEVAGQATNIFEAIPSSIGEDATSGQPDATINSNRQQPDMQTHDVSASLMKASEPGSQTQNNSIEMPTTRMQAQLEGDTTVGQNFGNVPTQSHALDSAVPS